MPALNSVKDIQQDVSRHMEKALEATKKEFQNLRTGRASIHLVEGIQVNYYNTPTPIKALAQVSTPDMKTILIQPWDQSVVAEVDRALQASDLGIMPQNDGKVIRLSIPPLTEERRGELTRLLKKVAEEGRVSVRNARHEGNASVKKLEKDKVVSEDDARKAEKDIQRSTDKHIELIDQLVEKKEQEIKAI